MATTVSLFQYARWVGGFLYFFFVWLLLLLLSQFLKVSEFPTQNAFNFLKVWPMLWGNDFLPGWKWRML